jgi:excinuclease UvrABC nuclease subunit
MQRILQQHHYPSGATPIHNNRSFFPTDILVQYPIQEINELKNVISSTRKFVEPSAFTAKSKKQQHKVSIRKPANRGARKETDRRALQCAIDNAVQVANGKALVAKSENNNVPVSSVDGTAMKELKEMLYLDKDPRRIECYDISHTQGENTVGSRVVFIDGVPMPSLYRTFSIKSVPNGKPDDYKSLEEVLERRFRRVWKKKTNNNDHDGTNGGEEEGTTTDHKLQLVDENDPWSMPDLVIIDGGKGQLSAALKGMSRANILPYEQSSSNSEETSTVLKVEDDYDDRHYENDDHSIMEEGHYSSSSPSSPTSLGSFSHVARVPIVALAKKREEVFVNNE